MKAHTAFKQSLNRLLSLGGAQVISRNELESLREKIARLQPGLGPSFSPGPLPEGAEDYLTPDNPRLAGLRSRYRALDCPAVHHSLWTDERTALINLKYFRGNNPYVYQFEDQNTEVSYHLTAYYLKSIDTLNLLGRLHEDGAFGCYTFECDRHLLVSRDLLDSVCEILFLEESMRISTIPNLKMLDIGAGYGRLAYRLALSLPLLEQVMCTDAVAESTFVSEYYLDFRGVSEKTRVVPLDSIEDALRQAEIHLAVNICSFSECTLSAISWWLDLVLKHRIRYLLIVPDALHYGGSRLMTVRAGGTDYEDFMPAILSRGYRLRTRRAKYNVPGVQRYGVSPTYYYLFEYAF
jgi:hypothetical protein